jgi:hypothetical protein
VLSAVRLGDEQFRETQEALAVLFIAVHQPPVMEAEGHLGGIYRQFEQDPLS